jgi:ribosome biogenesis GTPase / thiamine phosphate phosphatase
MKRNHELDALQTEERVRRNNAKAQRRQQLQTARKQSGPKQQQRKPPRWSASDDDMATHERIMPRDERDRRRAVAQATARIAQQHNEEHVSESEDFDGLVIEVSTGMCRVVVAGDTMLCRIRHHLRTEDSPFTNVVAVGDLVAVRADGGGGGMVEAVAPRRNVLARPDVFHAHKQQIIVANADQLLIVASWREPAIWFELVDRYLVTASRSELPVVLCVNKVDLVEDYGACARALEPYQALGVKVLLTSAQEGIGIDTLRTVLHNRVSVLAGLSGVGKSSLLAAAQPGLHLRTSDVSARKHEGRHTTTQATLVPLRDGGAVVDTPGIRQWGLGDLQRDELAGFFPDIAAVAPHCRFNNCAHLDDEDCAVRAAVAHGTIATSRYKSYATIYETL